MAANQQSTWRAGQLVTGSQMNNFANDIYQRFGQLTNQYTPCILYLDGAVSIDGSGNVTVPDGAFRFANTTYPFLPYNVPIFGNATSTTVATTGTGYVVARYSVSPNTPNQTNYTFPTTYVFTSSAPAVTDCIICRVSGGEITQLSGVYPYPDIVDNPTTGSVTIGGRIKGALQLLSCISANYTGWQSGVEVNDSLEAVIFTRNQNTGQNGYCTALYQTSSGRPYTLLKIATEIGDGSSSRCENSYTYNSALGKLTPNGVLQISDSTGTKSAFLHCYINDVTNTETIDLLCYYGTAGYNGITVAWDTVGSKPYRPQLIANLTTYSITSASIYTFGDVRFKWYSSSGVDIVLVAIWNGTSWGCNVGGGVIQSINNGSNITVNLDLFSTLGISVIGILPNTQAFGSVCIESIPSVIPFVSGLVNIPPSTNNLYISATIQSNITGNLGAGFSCNFRATSIS